MNVTITAHDAANDGDNESHRFQFLVNVREGEFRTEMVTLRTARVMVRELGNYTGLDAMMRMIVSTPSAHYDSLIGARFDDN